MLSFFFTLKYQALGRVVSCSTLKSGLSKSYWVGMGLHGIQRFDRDFIEI